MHDFVNNRLFGIDFSKWKIEKEYFTTITVLLSKRTNTLCKLVKNYLCNIYNIFIFYVISIILIDSELVRQIPLMIRISNFWNIFLSKKIRTC